MPVNEKYLPLKIAAALKETPAYLRAEELRLRVGQPPQLFADGEEYAVGGALTRSDIEETVMSLAGRSLAAFSDEISKGYITVEGGVRVGIAGRVVAAGGKVKVMRDFTSLNIRFPREIKGIGKSVLPHITVEGSLAATLIVSAPQHGKTTLLRDIVRLVSDGEGVKSAKCTVVDERMELWANGAFDLGQRTDVLSGCPKHIGMGMALRALSPDILATDEIGGEAELDAIGEAANCGTRLLASAHARNFEELIKRPFFEKLLGLGVIERFVVLSESMGRGTVEAILDRDGKTLCGVPFRTGDAL